VTDKILVIGGTGLVGNALTRAWARRGSDVVAATYHCHETPHFRQLDMQDLDVVRRILNEVRPGLVAVPAANPNVDYCEQHPEETRGVNVRGTLNVLRVCGELGARMIFFSSDYVFDGRQGVYGEDDSVSPLNEYGRQKAQIEKEVLQAGPGHLVVRTSGAYGWQWEPKNFVLQIRAKLGAGQPVSVAAGVRYNPTYVENLAEIVCELADTGRGGVYHVVGADRVARLEFAKMAARAFRLDESLIKGVPDGQYQPIAPRPVESSLKTDKVRALVKTPVWGIDRSLGHMASFEAEWKKYAERLPALK
jgi:dTDP-4-dehydrorhamnose reductase